MGETEFKVVQSAAGFLGSQMEIWEKGEKREPYPFLIFFIKFKKDICKKKKL
jgi:hypothetical protein